MPRRRGFSVERTWYRVGSWRIHTRFVAAGSSGRPAIVMVHGLGASGRYMVPTARLLGGDFDCYAPDLPGFGRSTKPPGALSVTGLADALAAWIDAAGLSAPVLVANSLGCQIAVEMILRHPGLARAAVLVGPTTDPAHRTAAGQIARWIATAPGEAPSLGLVLARDYLRCGTRRLVRTLRHAVQHRMEDRLPLVDVPVLVIRGSRDRIVPQRWAEQVASLLPLGRLVVVRGAAHAVNYTAPLALARLTRTFLSGPWPPVRRPAVRRDRGLAGVLRPA